MGGLNQVGGLGQFNTIQKPDQNAAGTKVTQSEQSLGNTQTAKKNANDLWNSMEEQQNNNAVSAEADQNAAPAQNDPAAAPAQNESSVVAETADKGKIYAKNGETFDKTAERLGFQKDTKEYEDFKNANKDAAKQGWFKLHNEVNVPDSLKGNLSNDAYGVNSKEEQAKWKDAINARRSNQNSQAGVSTNNMAGNNVSADTPAPALAATNADASAPAPATKTAAAPAPTVSSPSEPQVAASNEATKSQGDINGKFDEFIQQGYVGDCYLVSALDSVLAKKGGKEFVQKNINVNKDSGTAQVNIGGQKVNVKTDAVKAQNGLDKTGGDARLYEMAVDQYNRNQGQTNTDQYGTTLNGGFTSRIYRGMGMKNIGCDVVQPGQDYNYNKFNDPKRAYAYCLGAGYQSGPIATQNGNKIPLIGDHRYAVLGTKDGNVLMHDPRDKFDPNNPIGQNTLYVPISEMQKYKFDVVGGSFA